MSDSTTPPEGGKPRRPPISELDQPVDQSGADEVVARLQKNKAESAQGDPLVAEALRFRAEGFTILPLRTHSKVPVAGTWEEATRNNPAVALRNPGSQNFGVLPPPGCVALDVDKEAPDTINKALAALGIDFLPETRVHLTPNGQHWFWRWPEDLPRPRGPWFGSIVARWPFGDEGQGYVVAPPSVVLQDDGRAGHYAVFNEGPIGDLPREFAEAVLRWKAPRAVPASGALALPGTEGYALPEVVAAGGRYEAIRSHVAHLYNHGFTNEEMWGRVKSELAPRFTEPLSNTDLRARFDRAVRGMEERLGAPAAGDFSVSPQVHRAPVPGGPEPSTPRQEAGGPNLAPTHWPDRAAFIEELSSRKPLPYLVDGWVVSGGLTFWAGHPKSMKSLALLQLLGAYVAGRDFLGHESLGEEHRREGIYVTREGSHDEMLSRMRTLEARFPGTAARFKVVYEEPLLFDKVSYDYVATELANIESMASVDPRPLRALMVLDPLRDLLAGGSDENEAKVMGVVKTWCRTLITDFDWLSIIVVHHLRKTANGSSTGLDMSGSGAAYGAGDGTIVWSSNRETRDKGDALAQPVVVTGKYRVETRGDEAFSGRWRFHEGLIVPDDVFVKPVEDERPEYGRGNESIITLLRSAGRGGISVADISEETGMADGSVRKLLQRFGPSVAVSEGPMRSKRWYLSGQEPSAHGIIPVEEPVEADAEPESDAEGWTDPMHSLD